MSRKPNRNGSQKRLKKEPVSFDMSRKRNRTGWQKRLKKKSVPVPILQIEDTVLGTLPSKTGSNTDGLIAALSETPKKFTQLVAEVTAIKKHLEARLNTHDSKILLKSVEEALKIVDRFRRETKSRLPRFDWEWWEFLPKKKKKKRPQICPQNAGGKSAKKGLADSPRNNSATGSNTTKGHILHFQNKEYWCLCSAQDVGMEEPMNESSCLTLRRLKRSVAPATPSLSVDQPPLNVKRSVAPATPSLSVDQPPLNVPRLFIPPFLDPNMNDLPPLNVKEKKIWLEFKEFDKGTPEAEVINLDKLDHPIVSVIGDYAVAVFNRACEMHVKKGEHSNLHDLEFMECKYMKVTNGYYFYMTIEAIEEGNLGVYETEVVCCDDGSRILSKFVLTNRTPVGTKAMAIFHFSCVRSICKSLDGLKDHKCRKAYKIIRNTRGHANGKACVEISRICRHHKEAMQDLRQVLKLDPPLLFPPDCKRTTNQDIWSHPDDYYCSRMVCRTKGTPCRGYDYINI